MSYNFGDKDYGDYFKALETNLTEKHEKPRAETNQPKKHSRCYRVIRIKPIPVICVAAAAAVIITSAAVIKTKAGGKNAGLAHRVESADTAEPRAGITEAPAFNETTETADFPADNDCAGGIVVNTTTREITAQKNPHERLYPASTTKIMTVLVAAENIKNFSDTFTMSLDITDPLYIAEATVAGFSSGEQITMTDLLYGTILPSGADAATALAIKTAGSEAAFAELMNKKVKELGLKDTNFTNCTGLFDADQYTTAYDLALILEAALKIPICKKVLSTYQYTTRKTEQHPNGIPLSSTLFNYMYGTEPGTATIMGGKTGFVNESGYCIASYGTNDENGNEYIAVTLKNSSRWPAFNGQIELYKQFAK